MSAAACRISDLILIPCRPRAFDLDAIQTTADLVKASGKPAFVVFTAWPQRAIHLYREASEIVSGFGLSIAPVVLSERAAYHHATGPGKTAPEIEPNGKGAEEVAALWASVRKRANVSAREQAGRSMSRFDGLKQTAAAKAAPALAAVPDAPRSGIAKARENKKLVGGYFSPGVRRALQLLALEEGTTIQGLLRRGP